MAGRRQALLIAIDNYTDGRLRRLRAPSADAGQLQVILREPTIGRYDAVNLICGSAASGEIRRAVYDFLLGAHRSDTLLLHFALHGLKDADGRLYFAATDTDRDAVPPTSFASRDLRDWMDESRAARILVFLDCCFSGAFPAGFSVRSVTDAVDLTNDLAVLPSAGRCREVVAATSATEYAWERSDDLIETRPVESVFTANLTEGLATGRADLDGNGEVSTDDVFKYLLQCSYKQPIGQRPQRFAGSAGEIIVAYSAPKAAPRSAAITSSPSSYSVSNERSPLDLLVSEAYGPDIQSARRLKVQTVLDRFYQDDFDDDGYDERTVAAIIGHRPNRREILESIVRITPCGSANWWEAKLYLVDEEFSTEGGADITPPRTIVRDPGLPVWLRAMAYARLFKYSNSAVERDDSMGSLVGLAYEEPRLATTFVRWLVLETEAHRRLVLQMHLDLPDYCSSTIWETGNTRSHVGLSVTRGGETTLSIEWRPGLGFFRLHRGLRRLGYRSTLSAPPSAWLMHATAARLDALIIETFRTLGASNPESWKPGPAQEVPTYYDSPWL